MLKLSLVVPLGHGRQVEGIDSVKKQGNNLSLITVFGKNPSKNRNEGVLKSKSKYVAFINGHTVLDENWLVEVDKFFKKYPEVDIVGGPQLNPKSDGFFAKASGYALSSVFGAASMSNRYKVSKVDLDADEFKLTSANLICKREVFDKIKFDENIYPGEDPKFLTDAKKAGFNVAYSPNIIAYNKKRSSFFGLVKQIFTYGKMRPRKDSFFELLKHPVFFFPSLFLLYLLFLILFFWNSYWWFLPLVVYLGLNVIFSVFEGLKNKNVLSVFLLPFVFLSIHLSYGAGFLKGLIVRN